MLKKSALNAGKQGTVVAYDADIDEYAIVYDDGSVGVGGQQYYDPLFISFIPNSAPPIMSSDSMTKALDALRQKKQAYLVLSSGLKPNKSGSSSLGSSPMGVTSTTKSTFDDIYNQLMAQMALAQQNMPSSHHTATTTGSTVSFPQVFSVGDKVKATADNPIGLTGTVMRIGADGSHPEAVGVLFDGFTGGHSLQGTLPSGNCSGYFCRPADLELVMRAGDIPKKKVLDEKSLDALVLEGSVKKEIMAVLKQHENSGKLFDEWGLGETIEYGRGMSMMFWGGPGTGKTWGAHCIAKALGTTLLQISVAEIQSSEPGAAERNLQEAFKTAKDEGKVLFLDECDSLITTRADLGMVLAGQVNCLLTEIEKFEGVTILATNRIETMDEALERRLALIVEFPFPKYAQRTEIWRKMLPKKLPLAEGLTPEVLAQPKFSGGQIKNIILQAARLAVAEGQDVVTKENFDSAVARLNKSKGIMGRLERSRTGRPRDDMQVGVSTNRQIEQKVDLDTFLGADEEEKSQ